MGEQGEVGVARDTLGITYIGGPTVLLEIAASIRRQDVPGESRPGGRSDSHIPRNLCIAYALGVQRGP